MGMAINGDEADKLAEILNALGAHRSQFNEKSRSFIDDMIERWDEHGPNIRVSPKQWDWLNSLMEQL